MEKEQKYQLEITNKSKLSLEETLEIAAKFTRKRTMRIWIQIVFYVSKKHRKYFYLCYSYLRWVDNFVDNPGDKLKRLEFIENQLKLIEDLSNERNTESACLANNFNFKEEYFLYYFVKYAQQIKNYNLIIEVKHVLESIWLDAKRLFNGGIFSQDELNHYIDTASTPNSRIINYFLFPTHGEKKNIGKFIERVTILRDFYEDLEAGYINISKEDILKYNLNVSDLKNDEKCFKWMADKYPEFLNLFYEEISILKSMRFKAKLFWFAPYLVVLTMLIRIKIYNYKFGEKIKRNFINELKVFSQSFLLSLRTFVKVFF